MTKAADRFITAPQRRVYWRLYSAAVLALGLGRADAEDYRRRVMREEAGVDHLALIDRTDGFDAVCLRFCLDAGNYDGAVHFEGSGTRRLVECIEREARAYLGADADIRPYLAGICRQSRLGVVPATGDWWLDLGPRQLWKLLQMLSTARRRRT